MINDRASRTVLKSVDMAPTASQIESWRQQQEALEQERKHLKEATLIHHKRIQLQQHQQHMLEVIDIVYISKIPYYTMKINETLNGVGLTDSMLEDFQQQG